MYAGRPTALARNRKIKVTPPTHHQGRQRHHNYHHHHRQKQQQQKKNTHTINISDNNHRIHNNSRSAKTGWRSAAGRDLMSFGLL